MLKMMSIQVGDRIPSVLVKKTSENGIQDLDIAGLFEGKKVVMFGLPGAFTPVCSAVHLPGYVKLLPEFKKMGVDIVCMSVNDTFVMDAWAKASNADGIIMLADGNATFTKSLGLELDGSDYGLGLRSQRFALYAEDGKIKALVIEKPGKMEVSGAEEMMKVIKSICT